MATKHRGKLGIDLNKYEDEGGLTIGRMNFGLWLSQNRPKITRGIIAALIVISAITFIYSTYNYIFYFFQGREADQKLVGDLATDLINTQAYRDANSPSQIEVGQVQIFFTQGKYDFLVPVKNINPKHFSNFSYCLVASDIELACGDSFILPDSEKSILVTGVEAETNPMGARLVIKDLFWQRLNAHTVSDWNEYKAMRLNVAIDGLKYSLENRGSKTAFHDLGFTVKNESPYSYISLPLDLILYNGEKAVAVNTYLLENFVSGETREVKIAWPSAGERVTKAVVEPDVNILDNDVFLPYRGEGVK